MSDYDIQMFNYAKSSNEHAVSSSNLVMKSLMLINGGACVAVLSFISSIFDSNKLSQSSFVVQLSQPLIWFGWGVIISVFAMVFAYWTNFTVTNYTFGIISNGRGPAKALRIKQVAHALGVVLTLMSAAFFVMGMYEVRKSVQSVFVDARRAV